MNKERNLLKLLKDDQCLIAFKEAIINASDHLESSKAIAEIGKYGIAISHLVLGTEEIIKGFLLRLQSIGINLRNIPSIHLYFTDHIIRHKLAVHLNLLYTLIEPILEAAAKMKEQLNNPETEIEYTEKEKALISKDEKQIQILFKGLPEMLDWWDQANMKKNSGFYVDYSDKLETPMQINKEEYLLAYTITDNFIIQMKNIFSYIDIQSKDELKQIAEYSKTSPILDPIKSLIEARKLEKRNLTENNINFS